MREMLKRTKSIVISPTHKKAHKYCIVLDRSKNSSIIFFYVKITQMKI